MSDNISDGISIGDLRIMEARRIMDEFVVVMDAVSIPKSISDIIESILYCRGAIITSGMGKAGIVMRKFSSTLCSLGIPSCYLHPGEASHGDLGIIQKKDVLFIASTSGKTREIMEVIKLARTIGVKEIIGITSHPDSPIRKEVDKILDMGIIIEAGHLRIAPTSSILVMMALTDIVALVAAKEKGLTIEEYSIRHHSGYLGEKARGKALEKKELK